GRRLHRAAYRAGAGHRDRRGRGTRGGPQPAPLAQPRLVSRRRLAGELVMTPEIVVDAHARLGEGPVWDDQAEILYWVDILGKQVHAYGSGGDRVFDVGVHVGALALRRSGGLVLAVTDGFRLLDTETGTQAALS